MRYRREQQYQQLNRNKSNEEDCSWNSIIIWGVCISVVVLIILYVSFGPNLYHAPPVLVGSEQVSTLDEDKKAIPVYESSVNIDGVGDIFYRYTEPRGGKHVQVDILLLHGAKYGSQTWRGVGTLQILAYWGYRTYAIDLPGYQLSKKATVPTDKRQFMEDLIAKLRLSKVVIVAPSMSGSFGLPILLEPNDVDLRGFIAIAPQSTNKYSRQQYQSVKFISHIRISFVLCLYILNINVMCNKVDVPVLLMYGEKDNTPYKEEALYWMENIPGVTNVMVTKAGHAAFVGNPAGFHNDILRFLSSECTLGEDTEEIYDTDTDTFGDYNNYGSETDTDYYDSETDSTTDDQDFEEYLAQYFADNDGQFDGDYYDDTELYFDNADIDSLGYDDDTSSGAGGFGEEGFLDIGGEN